MLDGLARQPQRVAVHRHRAVVTPPGRTVAAAYGRITGEAVLGTDTFGDDLHRRIVVADDRVRSARVVVTTGDGGSHDNLARRRDSHRRIRQVVVANRNVAGLLGGTGQHAGRDGR